MSVKAKPKNKMNNQPADPSTPRKVRRVPICPGSPRKRPRKHTPPQRQVRGARVCPGAPRKRPREQTPPRTPPRPVRGASNCPGAPLKGPRAPRTPRQPILASGTPWAPRKRRVGLSRPPQPIPFVLNGLPAPQRPMEPLVSEVCDL